ncbi:flavocytochrome c [Shewanella sp. 5_MG-2023]|uniref:flavocytochrome c n=1 Tax=Shewanella sp. 5_MG-2023 TaxID=3062656 RepID=UPI0026E3B93E|nr:flavocytochrome c [Shewanella sp. 5_MG-2023]MDO6639285.1 flavocytochrome c [Shewanella sp. 5_MG-2023]
MKLKYLASAVAVMMLTSGSVMAKNDLASFHTEMGDCQSCHVAEKMKDIKKSMTDSQTHENAQCQDCHGGYADLVNDKLEFDPHASHLGDINCTSCHTAHAKPELTCNNCHNFEIEMPFADSKAKKKWDGDWNQDKIQQAIDKGPVETVDVIVVGGGSAGFNAAISAKLAGANVVLFEKAPYTGGNSMLAAGGINAVGTPQQKAKGIEDTVDWYAEDAMKGGRYQNDPKLVQTMAEESAGAVAWLESLGADMSELKRSGGARAERTHAPSGGASIGPHLIDTLRKAAVERDIPVRVNSRVEKIVLNDDQSVAGVVVHGRHSGYNMVAADSIVLATGGYGMNKQMVAYYRPTMKDMSSSNNVTATGDGVLLAKEIGASMTDIDWVQAHPTVGKDSRILISETVRGVGAIMVNTDGNRFINELTTRDRASDAILKQKDQYAWLVFDEQLVEKKKMVRGYEHLGMLSKANTIEELAKITGMADLPKTAADYNKYKAAGKDDAFGRANMPLSLSTPPYYAVKVAPGIHHTMGGIAIDTDTNILNLQSWKMPGLFAAGEVTGGVHGYNRLGGNAIADTVVFGRKAGENAAKHALKTK